LALVGYEWLIVVGVILVIFIWGPQKLPELARSIGLAKKEFDKATKKAAATGGATTTTPTTPATPEPPVGEPLLVAARSLGISTEGKTKEEIAKEIAERSTQK